MAGVIDHDRCLKREIADELAKEILKQEQIKIIDNKWGITYYSELLVLNPQHLKIVVEAVITMLSDEQIKKIKSGETNLF